MNMSNCLKYNVSNGCNNVQFRIVNCPIYNYECYRISLALVLIFLNSRRKNDY